MGHKQKVRRERQRQQQKAKKKNATTPATAAAQAAAAAALLADPSTPTGLLHVDRFLPKSDLYQQGYQLLLGSLGQLQQQQPNNTNQDTQQQRLARQMKFYFMRGATEQGCVHSMMMLGRSQCDPNYHGQMVYLGTPWYLEGAIRGSANCATDLVIEVLGKAQPYPAEALKKYWIKMYNQYIQWDGNEDFIRKSTMKELTDGITRKCIICFKEDTATMKLRQCMGCSVYCYCSEKCQSQHWDGKHMHKSECRQLQILEKYHKPYAREIRAATLRGEVCAHPPNAALEKLRAKLGLSRPSHDYQEFYMQQTYDGGTPIRNPYQFLVGRENGTVWVGSTPQLMGGPPPQPESPPPPPPPSTIPIPTAATSSTSGPSSSSDDAVVTTTTTTATSFKDGNISNTKE